MLRRALWALVAVVAVLGMHSGVPQVAGTAPAMAGMSIAAPALASTAVSFASDAPSAPKPAGGGHTMAAACAAILSVLGLSLLVAPARGRSSADPPARLAPAALARVRADRWSVGVPIPVRLCICRT